ncbi:hypothetical protein GCM10007207_16710 [Asaia siamensis]|uniref:Uncharacterized protein n=1 Tax=Asaia siamensis TaxID=110479 RepID=A0ABQ1M101_9PROT|nr:hypothetical protein AA0323_2887 [Asaia siamensis NRIC 0323]GGC31916.1 hypothetical protein GCM10007207_16710 [Asaia siamensis]
MPLVPLDQRIGGTAQASARRQKRKRLKQIGLARPIFASENSEAALRRPCQTLVIAKISEDEPVYTQIRPAIP